MATSFPALETFLLLPWSAALLTVRFSSFDGEIGPSLSHPAFPVKSAGIAGYVRLPPSRLRRYHSDNRKRAVSEEYHNREMSNDLGHRTDACSCRAFSFRPRSGGGHDPDRQRFVAAKRVPVRLARGGCLI